MDQDQILTELQFKASRSSGPGGQHANKVSSKMELSFDIDSSDGLTDRERNRLRLKLGSRLTKEGVLMIQCDESRSQHRNKELVVERFLTVLSNALVVAKKRKPSKPTRSSIEKRLQRKKKASLKKKQRGKPAL